MGRLKKRERERGEAGATDRDRSFLQHQTESELSKREAAHVFEIEKREIIRGHGL